MTGNRFEFSATLVHVNLLVRYGKASEGEIMTNVCEICGCENPATRMYEKEGEVFRMICDFHDKQVNEKKLEPEFKC